MEEKLCCSFCSRNVEDLGYKLLLKGYKPSCNAYICDDCIVNGVATIVEKLVEEKNKKLLAILRKDIKKAVKSPKK